MAMRGVVLVPTCFSCRRCFVAKEEEDEEKGFPTCPTDTYRVLALRTVRSHHHRTVARRLILSNAKRIR